MNRLSSSRSNGGFTLVEILVATAISVVLIGLVVGISGRALDISRETTNAAVRDADAQFALDFVIADLEALLNGARHDGELLNVTPETGADIVEDADSVWMVLLTHATDRDLGAHQNVPRAVSYRLAYQNVIDGSNVDPTYALYRAIATAKATFEHAMGTADLAVDFWQKDPPVAPLPTDVVQFLAGNVVGFEVRFLRADTRKWTTKEDIVRMRTGKVTVQAGPSATPELVNGGLLAAEARIVVISPQGAKLLEIGAITIEQAIERHGSSYSRQTGRFPALVRANVLPAP